MNLFDLFENDDSGAESITESGLPFGAQIYDKRTKEYIWSDFNSWKSAAEKAGLTVVDEVGGNHKYGVTHSLINQNPGDNQGDNEGSWVASPKYWGRSPFDGEGNPAKTPFGWISKIYLDSVSQQMGEGKATDILKAQIPMAKQIEADLAANGYVKGTPEYKHAYDVELDYYRKFGFQPNSNHELDEKSSAKIGAKLGSRLVNRRQAHALTTKFRKPKLNFEEDDEEQNLDEILAPSQLAKLQSIKAQLPKTGGQTPSIPSDTDRADAEAWLNKLKNKDPVADKKSGEDPLNFDRPGRPRQASYHEIQGKIEKLKSIKGLLKNIDKTEPRAMRSANKFGGADEISTKAQMMHDVVDNLNLNYTNEQELESIERRLSEYLQQLVAKSAAWKKPAKPNKHGAVTIIKPGEMGEISEGNDNDYPDYEDDEIDTDAGEMGTPEFRKALARLKQLANAGKPNDSTEKEQEVKKKSK